jgi:hypothetical protein
MTAQGGARGAIEINSRVCDRIHKRLTAVS